MNDIHPTAVIAPGVKIGNNVRIGAYTVIQDDCVLEDDCWIDANVKIGRWTSIGRRSRIYFGALVGDDPQDHRFREGTRASTRIGNDVTIREYVTIHRSPFENGVTSIGDGTLLMAFVHVGHDARIGNRVTAANHTAFSGHVVVGDGAVLSGYVLIHQFCRIGEIAMVGGRTIIRQDIPPYCMLAENEHICGPNVVGLRRNGFNSEQRGIIRHIIKEYFFRRLNAANALEKIEREYAASPEAMNFVRFIRGTERGIMPGDPALIALSGNHLHDHDEEDNS